MYAFVVSFKAKQKPASKLILALRRVLLTYSTRGTTQIADINIIRHLFEVKQLLCTDVAYTGNAYWVFMPLGLPAQKGWEVYSPLPGSHHPRLSEKFVTVSVFINAFGFEVQQLLCTYVAYTGRPIFQLAFQTPGSEGSSLEILSYRISANFGSL